MGRRDSGGSRRPPTGFSLVELLVVVVAIMAILTSLTLPALTGVWENAFRAVCRSNLRQCAIGIFTDGPDASGAIDEVVNAARAAEG